MDELCEVSSLALKELKVSRCFEDLHVKHETLGGQLLFCPALILLALAFTARRTECYSLKEDRVLLAEGASLQLFGVNSRAHSEGRLLDESWTCMKVRLNLAQAG